MKDFKKIALIAALSLCAQQYVAAKSNNNDDMDQQDAKPKHQGWGRLGTMLENTVTLHPGNAVNAAVTGDQEDTSFGYERNDEGKVKARKANTARNRENDNKKKQAQAKRKKEQERKRKQAQAKKQKSKKNND